MMMTVTVMMVMLRLMLFALVDCFPCMRQDAIFFRGPPGPPLFAGRLI